MTTTYQDFERVLEARFGGVLSGGKHHEGSEACLLEARAATLGLHWTDDPTTVRWPDLRPLNDAFPSNALRTAQMRRVAAALWDWDTWSPERQRAYTQRVSEITIRRILPLALRAEGLNDAADRCEQEGTEAAARAAARAITAAAWATGEAAWAVGDGATAAAWAAARDAA